MLEILSQTMSKFKSASKRTDRAALECESLESRMMLSTVDIFAAGTTGEETMEVRLFDRVLATFENVGGDVGAGEYEKYSFEIDFEGGELGDLDDLFIVFTNDLYIPGEVDRNLHVDAIVISDCEGCRDEGVRFETEASTVYSTGTWKPEDGVVRGYRESQVLHTNGFFNFSQEREGATRIQIEAYGNEGGEQFDLQVDGVTVESFTASQNFEAFVWIAPEDQRVDYDQVRIVFTNDVYDPENGIDRNLIVENVQVGRFTSRDNAIVPERSRTVFSTGTWRPEDGVTSGIRYSDTLHTNGYFQFGVFDTPSPGYFTDAFSVGGPDGQAEDAGNYQFVISRRGSTDGEVTIDYATRFGTADANDFVPVSGTAVFADGVSLVRVDVPVIDDDLAEETETFDFVISNPTGGAVLNRSGVRTVEILDDEVPLTGIYYEENFESAGDAGWTFDPFGTDTASRGQWEIGFAEQTSSGSNVFQFDRGFARNRSLATGLSAGSGIGSNDVDGGVTSALSPQITLPADVDTEVTVTYNFAHTSSATTDDNIRIGVVVDGVVVNILAVFGNSFTRTAQWREATIGLSDFAGQTIQLLVQAEDASNTVLEAAIGRLKVEAIS